MAVHQRRNERADRTGWVLQHHTAELITAWLQHQTELFEDPADGRASDNAGRVKGAGATVLVRADEWGPDERIPVTSVEAIVMRGAMMRDRREEVRDRLDGIIVAVTALNTMLRRDLRGTPSLLRIPELCDGTARGYDGHRLAWRPYDRSGGNGWHDASCRDGAGATGLCPPCLIRCNRWREQNGLKRLASDARSEVCGPEVAA